MTNLRRFLVLVLGVTLVVFVLATLGFGWLRLQAVEQRVQLESQVAQLRLAYGRLRTGLESALDKQFALQKRVKQFEETRSVLLKKLRDRDGRIALLEIDIGQEQQRVAEQEQVLAAVLEQLDIERGEAEQLQRVLAAARQGVHQVTAERRVLAGQLEALSPLTPDTVQLEKIVVRSGPSILGTVLAVNDEHGFVILDVGGEDQVSLGSILAVYRDDALIGRLQVEEVRPQISAATILPEWQGAGIMVSDVAKGL